MDNENRKKTVIMNFLYMKASDKTNLPYNFDTISTILRDNHNIFITRDNETLLYLKDCLNEFNENIDDTKAFMLEEDRNRVESFERKFWNGVSQKVNEYESYFDFLINEKNMDRKTFAIELMPEMRLKDYFGPSIIFQLYNGKNTRDCIIDLIKSNVGSQAKIDAIRYLWNDHVWDYYQVEE